MKALLAELGVTDGDEEIVLHLLEDLEPALGLVTVHELARVSTADCEDLHVICLERLVLSLYNCINESIRE